MRHRAADSHTSGHSSVSSSRSGRMAYLRDELGLDNETATLLHRGERLQEKGQLHQALKYFEQVLQKTPDCTEASARTRDVTAMLHKNNGEQAKKNPRTMNGVGRFQVPCTPNGEGTKDFEDKILEKKTRQEEVHHTTNLVEGIDILALDEPRATTARGVSGHSRVSSIYADASETSVLSACTMSLSSSQSRDSSRYADATEASVKSSCTIMSLSSQFSHASSSRFADASEESGTGSVLSSNSQASSRYANASEASFPSAYAWKHVSGHSCDSSSFAYAEEARVHSTSGRSGAVDQVIRTGWHRPFNAGTTIL